MKLLHIGGGRMQIVAFGATKLNLDARRLCTRTA